MLQIGILGIAGVLLAVPFKNTKSEYGIFIAVSVSLFIFAAIIGQMKVVFDAIREISEVIHLDAGYLEILAKMIGITYVSEFAAAICKDAGYQTIAVQIETFAKLTILVFCIPVITKVLAAIGEFLI